MCSVAIDWGSFGVFFYHFHASNWIYSIYKGKRNNTLFLFKKLPTCTKIVLGNIFSIHDEKCVLRKVVKGILITGTPW